MNVSSMMPVRLIPAVLVLAGLLSGCASLNRGVALTQQTVTPISQGEATAVGPGDLAEAMLRAGFTRDEILQYGPDVGRSLATSGGAQVRKGKVVSALFAVQGGRLIVTSLDRGTFVMVLTPVAAN